MTRKLTILSFVAAAALAGCNDSDQTITAGEPYDPQANAVQNLQNVQLPASITASHSYRCDDNSVVFIDWLSDDTARIKADRNEVGTTVTKGEDGSYTGEEQTLTGAADASSITVNGKTCKR